MRFRVTRVLCVSFYSWGGWLPSMHHRSHDWGICIQEGLHPGGLHPAGGIRGSLHPAGGGGVQTSHIGRPGILQDMVNKRAVRILLECILVLMDFITPPHVLPVRMFWLCAKPIFITDIPKPFKKSKCRLDLSNSLIAKTSLPIVSSVVFFHDLFNFCARLRSVFATLHRHSDDRIYLSLRQNLIVSFRSKS